MTERMEEIGDRLEAAACVYPATIDGHAALFTAIGERDEHAADDLVFLWERCASLEALVRELAKAGRSAECSLTEAIRDNKAWARDCDTDAVVSLRAALFRPLVSELTGEKEGVE